ncbi:MAG: type I-U CRISPR-associated protein Cas5/Cas6, partial [Gammaproteobacteria bacterium]|nr:type I-U CRISPR-associated protein Cas5/Cas6 [Gammaproteobacteria bacterium]
SFVPANEFVPYYNKKSRRRYKKIRPYNAKTWTTTTIKGAPEVYFFFENELKLNKGELETFKKLLSRVSRFGSSRNPVVLELVEVGPTPNYFPIDVESYHPSIIPVRVFYPGFLNDLERRHRYTPQIRTIPTRYWPYIHIENLPNYEPAFNLLPELRIAIEPSIPIEFWSVFVEKLRSKLIASALSALGTSEENFTWIHGHPSPKSTDDPLHVAIAPLAFVGSKWADGNVLGIAFLLPQKYLHKRSELAATLWQLTNDPRAKKLKFGPWEVQLLPPAGNQKSLSPYRWTQKSRRWATITPVIWERHPRRLQDEASIVELMLKNANLPRAVSYRAVPYSPLKGVPASKDFLLTSRWKGLITHMVLEFEKPIPGPVLLGRGKYFGLGFFAPLPEEVK